MITKSSNHDHFWIKDGVLWESYNTYRGLRKREIMIVPGMPDLDECTEEDIKWINSEYKKEEKPELPFDMTDGEIDELEESGYSHWYITYTYRYRGIPYYGALVWSTPMGKMFNRFEVMKKINKFGTVLLYWQQMDDVDRDEFLRGDNPPKPFDN